MPRKFGHRVAKDGGEVEDLWATPPSAVQGPVQNTSVRGAAELPSEGPRLMGGVGPAVANLYKYRQPQPNVPQSSPFLKRSRTVPGYGQGKGSGKGPGLDKVPHCNTSSSRNGGDSATDDNGEPAASPPAPQHRQST